MFKEGDLVIGIDQSYQRSIYEIVFIDDRHQEPVAIILFRSLAGTRADQEPWIYKGGAENPNLHAVLAKDYRLASVEEVRLAKVDVRKSYVAKIKRLIRTQQEDEKLVPVNTELRDFSKKLRFKSERNWEHKVYFWRPPLGF